MIPGWGGGGGVLERLVLARALRAHLSDCPVGGMIGTRIFF